MTSFIDYLHPDAARALKAGRALPFLIDYRHPEYSEHKLAVVGVLDTLKFYAAFYDDAPPSGPPVYESVPVGPLYVAEIDLPNDEARATHALWSMWESGVREDLMRYVAALGKAEIMLRYLQALYPSRETTPTPAAPPASSNESEAGASTLAESHPTARRPRKGKSTSPELRRVRKGKRT